MYLAFDIVALALATIAVMNVWFKGSIFTNWRGYYEAKGGRLGELLGCPLCLSVHVAFILAGTTILPALFLPNPWDQVVKLPLYVWAAIMPVQLYFAD